MALAALASALCWASIAINALYWAYFSDSAAAIAACSALNLAASAFLAAYSAMAYDCSALC